MRLALIALLGLLLIGCGPRGETRTLDQVLSTAKNQYRAASWDAPNDVQQLASQLETALSKGDTATLQACGDNLTSLINKAGYTSRPAMHELTLQYYQLAKKGRASGAQIKLLVARTYSLVASELETSRFALS